MTENRIKKSQFVFNSIIEDIRSKKINRGDLLPSEIELSRKYNVGRGTVREATQCLEMMGIISKQAGIGSIVKDFSMDVIFNPGNIQFDLDYKNLSQLLDFREIFDEIVIRLLTKTIDEKGIKEIKEIIDLSEFYCSRGDLEKFSEYDFGFHQKLAYLTNNTVVKNIYNLLFPFFKYIMKATVGIPTGLDNTLKDHREILEGLETKNLTKLEKVISRHISHVKEYLKQSF